MSDTKKNIDDLLRDSFGSFDGSPEKDIWRTIKEELDDQDEVLKEVRNSFDSVTTEPRDIWNEIDSSLSLESTWIRITDSLDQLSQHVHNMIWIKIAASLLLCFVPFYLEDDLVKVSSSSFGENQEQEILVDNIETRRIASHIESKILNSNGALNLLVRVKNDTANFVVSDYENEGIELITSITAETNKLISKATSTLDERQLLSGLLGMEEEEYKRTRNNYHRFGFGLGTNIIFMNEHLPKYLDSHSPIPGYNISAYYERMLNSNGLEVRIDYNKSYQKNGYFDNGDYKESKDVIASSSLQLAYKRYFLGNRLALKIGGGVNYNWVSYKVADDKIIDFLQFKPFHGNMTTGFDIRPSRVPIMISMDYSLLKDSDPYRNGIRSIHSIRLGVNYFFQK